MRFQNMNGFSLVEVLITIGIIGLVAAMTLPAITAKYRRKVLETQFKKSVSVISQAIMKTKVQLGSDKFVDFCIQYNETDGYYASKECYDAFYQNFVNIAGNKTTYMRHYNISRTNEIIKTYNGLQITDISSLAGMGQGIYETNIMPDGSFLNMNIIEYQFYINVDVNGQKSPNQLGHDIFIFTIDKNKDTLTYKEKPQNYTEEEIENGNYSAEHQKERKGSPCNFTSKQKGNGVGCAWYALRDECPDESGRSYFECLP